MRNGANLEFTYIRRIAAMGVVSLAVEWSDTLAAGNWSSVGVTGQILTDNGTAQTVRVCRGCRHWTEAVDAAQSNVAMKTKANVIFPRRRFARQVVASSDPRNAARAQLLWQNATVSQTWQAEQ